MVFKATFNNISVILWQSILLVEETGGPRHNTDLSQVSDKLYRIMLYTSRWSRFELTTLVVIGTDCIGSCKSSYHTIMSRRRFKYQSLYNMTYIRYYTSTDVKCVKSCQFTKPCVFLNAYLQTFSVFQTYQQSKQSFTVKVLLFIDTNFRCFYKMQWTMGSWIHGFIDPWVLEFMVSNMTCSNQWENCISVDFFFFLVKVDHEIS
jgi:hypothetical protein